MGARRRETAEEEDEDSDLDGFIDDTPIDGDFGRKEVAATIREVLPHFFFRANSCT